MALQASAPGELRGALGRVEVWLPCEQDSAQSVHSLQCEESPTHTIVANTVLTAARSLKSIGSSAPQ